MPIYYRIGARGAVETCAAQMFANAMLKNTSDNFGLATGNSVKQVYAKMLQTLRNKPNSQFPGMHTWNLDEWDWPGHRALMSRKDPRTFRGFMDQHLLDGLVQMQFDKRKAHFPSDNLPAGQVLVAGTDLGSYDDSIQQAGGIHTWCIGIGQGRPENPTGTHAAFFEPEHFDGYKGNWWERCSYTALLPMKTRKDNVGYLGCDDKISKVPPLAITVGPATLLNHVTKQLIVLAFGENKAMPALGALEEDPSSKCPASIIQMIGAKADVCVHVFMDEPAAQHLQVRSRIISL